MTLNYAHSLRDLTGLESLVEVGGTLMIYSSGGLESLHGLDSLESVGQGITIWGNDVLATLSTFDSLREISGNLAIADNLGLEHLDGLEVPRTRSAQSPSAGNSALHDLAGLEALTEIGTLHLRDGWITDLSAPSKSHRRFTATLELYEPGLRRLNGLDALVSVGGSMDLRFGIEDLSGLPSLAIAGDPSPFRARPPRSISVDEPLEVGGNLIVSYSSLTTLDGIENVSFGGGLHPAEQREPHEPRRALAPSPRSSHLLIQANLSLTRLDGLENVTTVRGSVSHRP